MKLFKLFKSQSGQSMITAMLLGFGMAGVSGLVLWESQQAEKNLRIPRIRSAMSGVEAKVRMAATKPQTYNCTTDSTTTVGATCTLTIVNTDFQENFTGAKCSGSGACGIAVEVFTFVPATAATPAKVQTKISYQGQELSIKPIDVDIEVPLDLMQKSSVNCISLTAGAQPIFMGYRPDGSVICQALPSGCGVGEFVSAIDPTTLKLTCGKFPNSGSCAANQYMTKFDPMSNSPVCTTRADAFSKFGGNTTFSSTRGQVSNPARPGADSCVLITTTLPPTTTISGSNCRWSVGFQAGNFHEFNDFYARLFEILNPPAYACTVGAPRCAEFYDDHNGRPCTSGEADKVCNETECPVPGRYTAKCICSSPPSTATPTTAGPPTTLGPCGVEFVWINSSGTGRGCSGVRRCPRTAGPCLNIGFTQNIGTACTIGDEEMSCHYECRDTCGSTTTLAPTTTTNATSTTTTLAVPTFVTFEVSYNGHDSGWGPASGVEIRCQPPNWPEDTLMLPRVLSGVWKAPAGASYSPVESGSYMVDGELTVVLQGVSCSPQK